MRIGKRDKLFLTAAGAAVALYLLFQFALFPVWDSMQEHGDSIPVEEMKLAKYRGVVRTAALRGAEATSAETKLREAEGGLLTSKTAPLASAELLEAVRQLATQQSIDVRSNTFLPPRPLGADYAQVPVDLQFQCRLDQLLELLNTLGTTPKSLGVSKLMIISLGGKEKQLSVNLQVTGVMRAEAAKKES